VIMKFYNARSRRRAVRSQPAVELAPALRNRHSQLTDLLENFRLGDWVQTQRAAFVDGSLDADRQRRLEKLPGWTWTARAHRWDINYKLLLRYVEEHVDAQVPQSYQVRPTMRLYNGSRG
jgi:hypothetical protein